MNQILVTKKLYITPELKRKKKIYKFDFLISIILVIALVSIYIYTEYNRNKSEEVSQDLLAEMNSQDSTTAKDNGVLVAVLDDSSQNYVATPEENNEDKQDTNQQNKKKTAEGFTYTIIGSINIPKINVNYPILEGETGSVEETESLLKNSPCKFWGPNINEKGNFCIVGHNYRNSKFFSKVPTLENGDTFEVTNSVKKETLTYKIYDKYVVDPKNVSCTSQLTGGKKEVTLITCTDDSQQRVIVKAREIK